MNSNSISDRLPLVSIVLPVYKPELEYFKSAIESIERQDYQNYEVILSDDGHSLVDIMKDVFPVFLQRSNVIVVENKGPKGIFSNINNALKYASGDLFQLFSQDDVMNDTLISQQVDTMRLNPKVGMVFCDFEVIDERGVTMIKGINYTFRRNSDLVISTSEAPALFLEYGCLPGNISPVMIRNDAFKITGPFNQELPYAGDFDYWIRLSRNYAVYYRQGVGLQVRRHLSQASQTIPNTQLLIDLVEIYKRLLEMIPSRIKGIEIRRINRRVGAAFLHDTLMGVIRNQKSFNDLKLRYRDLKRYPFDPFMSSFYYIVSIPLRIVRKLI